MTRLIRANVVAAILGTAGLAGLVLMGVGCGDGQDRGAPSHAALPRQSPDAPAPTADPNANPYPLKTCLVSGEELGKMGEPYRLTYKGQEIKLCCKGCEKDFNKEPDKFLQKIAAATK